MSRWLVPLLLLPSLALAEPAAARPKAKGEVLATLARTACYGTCPVYSVTVFTDGRVDWNGEEYVQVKGPATAKLSAKDLADLRAAFAKADYFNLKEDYACEEITDHPSAQTSFHDGKRQFQINHDYGCRSKRGIPALTQLESDIDRIVGTSRWIGSGDAEPASPLK
jgi:hypothetical protein